MNDDMMTRTIVNAAVVSTVYTNRITGFFCNDYNSAKVFPLIIFFSFMSNCIHVKVRLSLTHTFPKVNSTN